MPRMRRSWHVPRHCTMTSSTLLVAALEAPAVEAVAVTEHELGKLRRRQLRLQLTLARLVQRHHLAPVALELAGQRRDLAFVARRALQLRPQRLARAAAVLAHRLHLRAELLERLLQPGLTGGIEPELSGQA